MFLGIDKKKSESVALIDDEGSHLTYGELVGMMDEVGTQVEPRSLVFQLCKNTVGSVAGYLGFIEHDAVPVTLNAKIDQELLESLLNIYIPAYIWAPVEEANRFDFEKVYEIYGYVLLKTGYALYPLNEELQLCMTTSGSTGSPSSISPRAKATHSLCQVVNFLSVENK